MASFELPQDWLRDRLQQHGINQRRLADALEIDAGSASRLIGGKRRLQFDELPRLIALLSADAPDWRLEKGTPIESQFRGRLEGALKTVRMDPTVFADLGRLPKELVFTALEKGGAVADDRVAEAAAKLLGVSRGWLQMAGGPFNTPDVLYNLGRRWGTIPEPKPLESAGLGAPTVKAELSSDIPVYAAARHLGGGEYEWNETVAETREMPTMSRVKGAWGLFVGPEGIPPRFPAGAVLYIHPNGALRHGDFAILRTGDRLVMGTAALDGESLRLLDGAGELIREMDGQRLEKVVLATFD